MSVESKSIVHGLYEEVWNKRKLEVVDRLISPSHALQDPIASGSQVGPAMYKQRVVEMTTAFPDLRFTVEDTIAEREKLVVCWTFSGTHKGEFLEIPGSGRKISVEGITIHHIRGGKILDSYARWDVLGLMRQLGVVPAQGKANEAVSRVKGVGVIRHR